MNKNANMFLTSRYQQLTTVFVLSIGIFIFLSVIFFQQYLLFADEAGYKTALAQLKMITDRIPNDADGLRICQNPEINLSDKERSDIEIAVLSLQKPNIDVKTILALFKARRDSLSQCKISYSEIIQNPPNSKHGREGRTSRDYVFAFSKNRYYLERNGKRWVDDYEHSIISYDGNNVILVAFPKDNIPNADITEAGDSFELFFFQLSMPLFYTRHFDESRLGESINNKDIIGLMEQVAVVVIDQQTTVEARAAWIYQPEQEVINGSKCIILADHGGLRFYLDVERDYSIVRLETFHQNKSRFDRKIAFRSDLFDYVDYGNGNWIPSKIENTYYTDGKPDAFTFITVHDVQTTNIPDSLFSDVIPENAFVFDGIRKMTYKQSDHPSINSLIKETAKSKRVFIYRYISVISGLILIFIALALKYRAYLKDKRERENKTEEETK